MVRSISETAYPVIDEKDDVKFFQRLDSRLHFVEPTTKVDHFYYNDTMSLEELDRVLELVNRYEFMLYPIRNCANSTMAFQVAQAAHEGLGLPLKAEPLLTFLEEQLPIDYRWEYLYGSFMKRRNRELMDLSGLRSIAPKRDSYLQ